MSVISTPLSMHLKISLIKVSLSFSEFCIKNHQTPNFYKKLVSKSRIREFIVIKMKRSLKTSHRLKQVTVVLFIFSVIVS